MKYVLFSSKVYLKNDPTNPIIIPKKFDLVLGLAMAEWTQR
jgi:hypothetical protein